MASLKNTYLARVYRSDTKLFGIIAAFGGLTLLCNLAGIECTPFFVWGMYSEKIPRAEEYEILKTTVNDTSFIDTYAGYSDNTRFFCNAPLQYYELIRDNNGVDPTISFLQRKLGPRYTYIQSFQHRLFNSWAGPQFYPLPQPLFYAWYGRYLASITGNPVSAITISHIRVHYDAGQHLITDAAYLTEKWRQR